MALALQIGLEDGLFQIAMTHKSTGVDIDGGHGLSLVNHRVPARLELDMPAQRLLYLILHAVEIKSGRSPG